MNNNDEGFTQSDSITCDTILFVITVNCMWYYIRSGNSFIIYITVIAGQNFELKMGSMYLKKFWQLMFFNVYDLLLSKFDNLLF
jgi:hypothetical protein